MKYLRMNVVDTSTNLYPKCLESINITIRGTKNLFNIFFNAEDIEKSFDLSIPPGVDYTSLQVGTDIEQYISYPILKRTLLNHVHPLIDPYLGWIDSLIFSNKVKSFYQDDSSELETEEDCLGANTLDEHLIASFQHKIQELEHVIALKDKDLHIMGLEIELMKLKMAIRDDSEWI